MTMQMQMPPINNPFDWTEAALLRLRSLLKAGHSRRRIAEFFSEEYKRPFTKNQIHGAVDRYKLADLGATIRVPRPKAIKKRKPSLPQLFSRPRDIGPDLRAPGPKTITSSDFKIRSVAVHDYAKCKWVEGDPTVGGHTVCGQPAAINWQGNPKPYCHHHCEIAYVKPRERAHG